MPLDQSGLKQLLNDEIVHRLFSQEEINLTASKSNNPYEWSKISDPTSKKRII